jgi:hypothetical protein
MTDPSSVPASKPSYASPEAYLAELDEFVQSVQSAGTAGPADAETLRSLLGQAELYLQAGQYPVAATAYERLLVIMRHFEGTMEAGAARERLAATPAQPAAAESTPAAEEANTVEPPATAPDPAPAEDAAETAEADLTAPPEEFVRAPETPPAPRPRPAAASFATPPPGGASASGPAFIPPDTALPRRRVVHVERKRIRPYRSPDTDTSRPPELDEIQRPAAGFRLSTPIPSTSQQRLWRRLLPLALITVVLATAVWVFFVFFNGNSLLAVAGLGGTTPTARIVATQPAPSLTLAIAGLTRVAVQTATQTAPASPKASVTPAVIATSTSAPTSTPSPTLTNTPPPTETPTETATPTATATDTPSPTPTMVFTGPDPLAGATQFLFEENFNPKTYYWLLGETTFGRSRINNGALEITTKTTHSIAWVFGGMAQGLNFFEMATVKSGACNKDDHFGLVLRAESDSNLILFGVTCDGRYRLQQNQGGIRRLLVLPTASDAIQTGLGAVNELGVRAEGKQISLYVNRQFLTRVETTDLSRGSFGAYVQATTTANLTVSFGSFRAWLIGP